MRHLDHHPVDVFFDLPVTNIYAGDFFFLFVLEEPHRMLTVAGQSILPQMIGEGKDSFADENKDECYGHQNSASDCGESELTAHPHGVACIVHDNYSFKPVFYSILSGCRRRYHQATGVRARPARMATPA